MTSHFANVHFITSVIHTVDNVNSHCHYQRLFIFQLHMHVLPYRVTILQIHSQPGFSKK